MISQKSKLVKRKSKDREGEGRLCVKVVVQAVD